MQRPAKKIDSVAVQRATTFARGWKADTLRVAERLKEDSDAEQRKAEQLCQTCYYLRKSGIAGQAITTQPCGICEENQTYSSTATDVLCKPCAEKHQLCKRCGADIKFRTTTRIIEAS